MRFGFWPPPGNACTLGTTCRGRRARWGRASAQELPARRRRANPTPKTKPAPRGAAAAQPDDEARRSYRVSLGPWSSDFSVPEWLDVLDLTDRARGFGG